MRADRAANRLPRTSPSLASQRPRPCLGKRRCSRRRDRRRPARVARRLPSTAPGRAPRNPGVTSRCVGVPRARYPSATVRARARSAFSAACRARSASAGRRTYRWSTEATLAAESFAQACANAGIQRHGLLVEAERLAQARRDRPRTALCRIASPGFRKVRLVGRRGSASACPREPLRLARPERDAQRLRDASSRCPTGPVKTSVSAASKGCCHLEAGGASGFPHLDELRDSPARGCSVPALLPADRGRQQVVARRARRPISCGVLAGIFLPAWSCPGRSPRCPVGRSACRGPGRQCRRRSSRPLARRDSRTAGRRRA